MAVTLKPGRNLTLARRAASKMVRLRHRDTREFLHMSRDGTTPTETWSWLGWSYQAEALRRRAASRGQDWPFEIEPRDGESL